MDDIALPVPGARVATRVKGNGEGGFQFEIAHRLCGKKKVESLECDDFDDFDDDFDYDEARTKHEHESTQDHEQTASSVLGIPHSNTLNFYDAESEHTQLASWLQQCPSLQTVAFLSGAEWCFLAEGRGSGVWVNSYD